MRNVIIFAFLALLCSCNDRFRYSCQDPDHFNDKECVHPRCEFSQTCPEYLTAPVK